MPLIRKAVKRLHYLADIIAQCVCGYLAYALSLGYLEEIMAEHGIIVDHSTLHRRVIRLVPLLDKAFRQHKRTVTPRSSCDRVQSRANMYTIKPRPCYYFNTQTRLRKQERRSVFPQILTLSEMSVLAKRSHLTWRKR